ncbi:MAG: DNA alkylation repair protein [Bacteroidota bacterium]
MTKEEVFQELEEYGNAQTKKVLTRHGAREPFFGVKVQDLKKIVKKVKKNHELSLELYESGNSDAMYLAGLIADETRISKEDLNRWARQAYWYMLSDYAVAAVASESPHGQELGLEWIDSDHEMTASAGWATLSGMVAIKPNEELDLQLIDSLLDRVEKEIHQAPNRTRYTINGFVIAVGSYIPSLTEKAMQVAQTIGKVDVKMGKTSCKVPFAPDYIQKIVDKGRLGKKRKVARC